MHLPKINEEKNWDVIAGFIHQYSFATLVHVLEGKPKAAHLPLELERSEDQQERTIAAEMRSRRYCPFHWTAAKNRH
ncbi:hypothetical protein DCC81_09425 [Chitinophaga parva]|uniref:Uncharacterized protein n=1 Tax=Chitinophaga parva TaxID=2169414 RepID=A0A2T7BPQ2_9BACT|nr:FMN-binding negative transcriptional regulator [Chitinophaga parva]PUZ29642.1 hypothetical protein DCC81_09425 [Chitinophaga parva]